MPTRLTLYIVLLFAFFLRIHDLERLPLRGDEAFAVRYWAAPPSEVLSGLAQVEPHPLGTFFTFWAWKTLVGDTEFAMRMLPALVNLIGAASMYALTLRLARKRGAQRSWGAQAVALLAACIWAINPNLIWHSQDVRNYAIWAGLSVCALWLLVRAVDSGRRRDWVLYVLVEVIALYVFFLEAFILVVHGLYVLFCAHEGADRRVPTAVRSQRQITLFTSLRQLRVRVGRSSLETIRERIAGATWAQWVAAFIVIDFLLIPWTYQIVQLAGSSYGGTAGRSDFGLLASVFVPELLYGEGLSGAAAALPGVLITGLVIACAALWWLTMRQRAALLALLLMLVPSALLFAVGLRLDIFRPRYLIAVTPALILVLTSAFWPLSLKSARLPLLRPLAMTFGGLLLVLSLFLSADALMTYFGRDYRKGADWRALGAYLDAEVDECTVVLIVAAEPSGGIDPAFQYYYEGAFEVLPRTDADVELEIAALLAGHARMLLIDQPSWDQSVRSILTQAAAITAEDRAGDFRITIYHSR